MASLREGCRRGVRPLVSALHFRLRYGREWRTLAVLDLEMKGKIRWQQKPEDPLIGSVLATAGGPVFIGEAWVTSS